MAATQHHSPGMFVPRVIYHPHFITLKLDAFYQETDFQLDLSGMNVLCI